MGDQVGGLGNGLVRFVDRSAMARCDALPVAPSGRARLP
jgi:hypothetical protein